MKKTVPRTRSRRQGPLAAPPDSCIASINDDVTAAASAIMVRNGSCGTVSFGGGETTGAGEIAVQYTVINGAAESVVYQMPLAVYHPDLPATVRAETMTLRSITGWVDATDPRCQRLQLQSAKLSVTATFLRQGSPSVTADVTQLVAGLLTGACRDGSITAAETRRWRLQ